MIVAAASGQICDHVIQSSLLFSSFDTVGWRRRYRTWKKFLLQLQQSMKSSVCAIQLIT